MSNDGATIFVIFVALIVYFLPSFAAAGKKNGAGVFVVNLFLGWTLLGWVVALAWAVSSPRTVASSTATGSAIGPSGELMPPSESVSDIKRCPFCAEDIKRAAIVCKHCGRDLPQSTPESTPARSSGSVEHPPPPAAVP